MGTLKIELLVVYFDGLFKDLFLLQKMLDCAIGW
jgi:hypothetical protein